MDPRVSASNEDLQIQSKYSLICHNAYQKLQNMKEAMNEKLKSGKMTKEEMSVLTASIGTGNPGGGDILYGSIYESSPDKETIVSLQEKFLYMLHLLQTVDARPTPQSILAIVKLEASLKYMESH
jgi:hypothetical protein